LWLWRSMMKIIWREHVSNNGVFEKIGVARYLLHKIQRRKTACVGHDQSQDSMQRDALEGRIEGKRPRGRKRLICLHMIMNGKGDNYQSKKAIDLSQTLLT